MSDTAIHHMVVGRALAIIQLVPPMDIGAPVPLKVVSTSLGKAAKLKKDMAVFSFARISKYFI